MKPEPFPEELDPDDPEVEARFRNLEEELDRPLKGVERAKVYLGLEDDIEKSGTPIPPEYREAYESAPPETKEAIEAALERHPDLYADPEEALLYEVLGTGTSEYKVPKEDADYKKHPVDGEKCGNCKFAFEEVDNPGSFICSQVQGHIKPEHWCQLWEPGDKLEKSWEPYTGPKGGKGWMHSVSSEIRYYGGEE